MSEFQKPNINQLFKLGQADNLKNSKHKRLFESLKWRQAYQNCDHYEYQLENNQIIRFHQITNGEMKGLGTGTFVWPAAHILSKYLELRYSTEFQNKRVCDIGTGTGLTGFIAGLLGAEVVLTDQSIVMDLLKQNLSEVQEKFPQLNNKVKILEYDWINRSSFQESSFDYLLISDCVLPKLYPIDMLIDAVDYLMGPNTVALFSYEHRPFPQYDPRQEFKRLAELKGMVVKLIPFSNHHPVYSSEDIEIWEVRRIDSLTQGSNTHQPFEMLSWGENLSEVKVIIKDSPITIRQEVGGGIGGILWPSSAIGSKYICGRSFLSKFANQNISNLTALDLGSGCGLTSIALHQIGFKVLATDTSKVLPLLQENIDNYLKSSKNCLATSIIVKEFEWGHVISSELFNPDFIVCSDCIYDSTAVDPLINILNKCISKPTMILLINELRSALEEFLYLIKRIPNVQVDLEEIEITEPELELIRSSSEVIFSRPLRMCWIHWKKIE